MPFSQRSLWGLLFIVFAKFVILSQSHPHVPHASAAADRLQWRQLNTTNTTTVLSGTANGTVAVTSSSSQRTSSSAQASVSSAFSSRSSSSSISSSLLLANGTTLTSTGSSTIGFSSSGSQSSSSNGFSSISKSSSTLSTTASSNSTIALPTSNNSATSKASSSAASGTNIGSFSKSVITSTVTNGGSVVITQPPTTTTVTQIPTGTEITTSATEMSSEFVLILPFITNWMDKPEPPKATEVVAQLDKIIPKAKNLLSKFPKPETELDPCSSNKKRDLHRYLHQLEKRAFLDGLFKTAYNLISCVIDNTNKIKDGVTKGTKDIVDAGLKDLQPQIDALNKLDPEEPEVSKITSGTTTKSSSECSSKTVTNCDVKCSATVTTTVVGNGRRQNGQTVCSSTCTPTVTACSATGKTDATTTTSTSTAFQKCEYECEPCRANNPQPPNNGALKGLLTTEGKFHLPVSTASVATFEPLKARSAVQTAIPKAESTAVLIKESALFNLTDLFNVTDKTFSKRTLPNPARDHNNDITNFMLWRISQVRLVPHGAPPITTTATTVALTTVPEWHGVMGLYGCTSVIVVSRKRMWISHIWENPSFTDPTLMQRDLIDKLEMGGDPGVPEGIASFTGPGGDFEDIPANKVRAYIMTPTRYPLTTASFEDIEYRPQVEAIEAMLRRVLNVQNNYPMRIPYVRLGTFPSDPNPRSDPLITTARGKVVVMYDPLEAIEVNTATGCTRQKAALEIWAEDSPQHIYRDTWEVFQNQQIPLPPAVRRNVRELTPRQADSCPLPPKGGTTATDATGTGTQTGTKTGTTATTLKTGTTPTTTTNNSASSKLSATETSKTGTTETSKMLSTATTKTATLATTATTTSVASTTSTTSTIKSSSTTTSAAAPTSTGPSYVCKNGSYADFNACTENCGVPGALCSENAGQAGIVCTCPPRPACKNGSYRSFDECGWSCSLGLCTESAGVVGVTCAQCP